MKLKIKKGGVRLIVEKNDVLYSIGEIDKKIIVLLEI